MLNNIVFINCVDYQIIKSSKGQNRSNYEHKKLKREKVKEVG